MNILSVGRKVLFFLALAGGTAVYGQERAEVLLETTEGNIRIALYNETPQHRDNFLKVVGMQLYDSLLFHRVIKDFMVQSGDLNSKHAKPGELLGTGELDYTTEAEFRLPQLFHRRGAVAAARESDKVLYRMGQTVGRPPFSQGPGTARHAHAGAGEDYSRDGRSV